MLYSYTTKISTLVDHDRNFVLVVEAGVAGENKWTSFNRKNDNPCQVWSKSNATWQGGFETSKFNLRLEGFSCEWYDKI